MRYEVSQEPKDVEPGDIAVMRLVTTKGAVKWTCGTVRCFTDGRSALMLICARVRYVTSSEWSTRRYLDMSRPGENVQSAN